MFDFAWSELGMIAVVALIFIGPKDLPVAVKSITRMIKKARGMASEFQTHVDDLVRDADLHEVRDQLSSLRGYTIKGAFEKFVDEDGSIRRSFDDPLTTPAASEALGAVEGDVAVADREETATDADAEARPEPRIEPVRPDMPAFIPPGAAPLSAAPADCSVPPAFIPPEFARAAPPGPAT